MSLTFVTPRDCHLQLGRSIPMSIVAPTQTLASSRYVPESDRNDAFIALKLSIEPSHWKFQRTPPSNHAARCPHKSAKSLEAQPPIIQASRELPRAGREV
eukprot:229853-Pyramimonas_sp.AAC.1